MAANGIPHRSVWTPVRNGRPTHRCAPPAALTVALPDFGVSTDPFAVETVYLPGEGVDDDDLMALDVAASVAREIHDADMKKDLDVFGAAPDGCDPLFGHISLTQAKVAVLLGALHGEVGILAQWWGPAGLIMDVSKATMEAAAVVSGAADIVAERQAGERLGHRFVASDAVRDDAKMRDVANRLYERVGNNWAAVNAMAVITKTKHGFIPDAWRWLINVTGKVEAEEHEYQAGKKTWRYRRIRSNN